MPRPPSALDRVSESLTFDVADPSRVRRVPDREAAHSAHLRVAAPALVLGLGCRGTQLALVGTSLHCSHDDDSRQRHSPLSHTWNHYTSAHDGSGTVSSPPTPRSLTGAIDSCDVLSALSWVPTMSPACRIKIILEITW